jgi:hypothetical protein
VRCLLDFALDPVLDAATSKPSRAQAETAILALKIVDPACGSGHFLIAAAHRLARRLASVGSGEDERVPVLIRAGPPEENPWGVRFLAMLHMSNDSDHFRTREQLERDGWTLEGNRFRKGDDFFLPLYEAKMVHHFDHRYGDYQDRPTGSENTSLPDVSLDRLRDPAYAPLPRYWVPRSEVDSRLANRWSRGWLLGWRDICRSTDERTVIASVLPRVGVGHNMPLFLSSTGSATEIGCLLENLNSFALDYLARQKVGGTHLTYIYLKQLPILAPSTYTQPCPWSPGATTADWMRPRILELTYTAHDLEPFARDLGYDGPPFRFEPERRFLLRCELDAAFFHLYGISADDAAYILDTFPIVRRQDEGAFGTYRTKDTILRIYGALAGVGTSTSPDPSLLRTPPAQVAPAHVDGSTS